MNDDPQPEMRRPQVRVKPAICALAGGLVLPAALALLPAALGPATLGRQQLLAAGVALGASITPGRQESAFWLALLAISAGVFLFTQAHPLRSHRASRSRRSSRRGISGSRSPAPARRLGRARWAMAGGVALPQRASPRPPQSTEEVNRTCFRKAGGWEIKLE